MLTTLARLGLVPILVVVLQGQMCGGGGEEAENGNGGVEREIEGEGELEEED